jgi:D-alanyl-D-alanine dipeptidase
MCLAAVPASEAKGLPPGFVYLRNVAPSIIQDMRYATPGNFTGKPVPGYQVPECILQRGAAEALKRAQDKAQALGYSLKVYDCYRPVSAVSAFMSWAAAPADGNTRRFLPHLRKSQLVPDYIASQSGHSRGASIDVTIVPSQLAPAVGSARGDCTSPPVDREPDNSLDMGTAFDCFDPKANTASPLASPEQRKNRELLKSILERAGFQNYAREWWHYTYKSARDKRRYDFPIEPRPAG